jgi:pyrimidine operon attenuation protein / uracil phosphoribosyltransferase
MNTRKMADGTKVQQMIDQLAAEIESRSQTATTIVGVRTNGVPIAERIAKRINAQSPVGAIDITLYRDDLASRALPEVHGSDLPQSIDGQRLILVDDVLFTGRTIRAALSVLAEYGRPNRIELCVLVDRGHRELPICADYTGMKLETTPAQHVRVNLTETGSNEDEVILTEEDTS